MMMNIKIQEFIFNNSIGESAIHNLSEWRAYVLEGILRGILVVWLFALIGGINNVFELYLHLSPISASDLMIAVSLISIYLATTALLIVSTFSRKLKYELRAGLFLFILYVLGLMGLVVAALSGDGRVFLLAFIIFSSILFNYRHSLFALALGIGTLISVGWLEVTGVIVVSAENQVNSTDAGAWVSGSLVLSGLSIAALISITYLLQALAKSLAEAQQSLNREKKISRMLHAISDINQLIVREEDPKKLLAKACERLIVGLGYGFVWIGLLEPDGITLNLSASAGETIDPEKFSVRLDETSNKIFCAISAIRSGQIFHMDAAPTHDLCAACPRSFQQENRSAIALPLFREERKFGALVLEHVSPTVLFANDEVSLLKELADDLAYALDHLEANRRLQTYARHQALLNEITQNALETPDLNLMLQKFIVGLEKALNMDFYYIALWDEIKKIPTQFFSSEGLKDIFSDAIEKVTPVDRLFSQSILECGHALVVDDITTTPYISPHIAALFPVRSALGMPLIAKNHKLGVLVFCFREPHHFSTDEIELGEQVSRQIGLAILKANFDYATHARAVELGHLYAAALDISYSMIDPPVLLVKLANHITEALEATSGNIISVNLAEYTMQVVAEYWDEAATPLEKNSNLGASYSFNDYSTITNSMLAGRALTLHATTADLTAAETILLLHYGVQSMLFVPIISSGGLLGCIEVLESRRQREFTLGEIRMAQAMAGHAAGILEKARLFERLEQRESYFRALIENSAEGIAILDAQGIICYIASAEEDTTGYKTNNLLGTSIFNRIHKDDLPSVLQSFELGLENPGMIQTVQYRFQRADGEWRYFEAVGHNLLDDSHIRGIVLNYRDITERKQAEQALQEHQSRLEAIITTTLNGIVTINTEQQIILFNPAAEKIFGCSASEAIGQGLEKFLPERYRHAHQDHIRRYIETDTSSRRKGLLDTLYGLRATGEEFPLEAFISQSEVNGQKLLTVIFQDITERKSAEENMRRRAFELETIVAASSALRTAQRVAEMLPTLAHQALRAVNASYASIFLLDAETGDFVSRGWYSAGTMFTQIIEDEVSLRHLPNEGIAGRIVASGDIYVTEDLQKDSTVLILDGERERLKDVHGGISLPLRAQEKIIGVMHIWSLTPRIFTETEIRLLIALAETASNAIHRAALFEQTQQHADEITQAYDNTLAGWARALELRDEITEGHTRRVTALTVQLARFMNVPEDEIVHIRRGALLHDIGKMGIPDSILHKPGAFTAQERFVMEQHTQYAYDMLSPILFLHAALDIPRCHHEHWDGNGYPRKLQGEEIPLSARIFAVVDVWDALTSDRPYRLAWTYEKTREYICERAGKQFDPRVVQAFFSLKFQ